MAVLGRWKGCQKISSKLRFCFLPETETLHFRKIEFEYCVFLAQAHLHKTEPCFVSKFPEGHSSLRLKKIFLIYPKFPGTFTKS